MKKWKNEKFKNSKIQKFKNMIKAVYTDYAHKPVNTKA